MKQTEYAQLWTPRGEKLRQDLARDPALLPWEAYPRPRLVREGWINLNGLWDFGASESPEPVYGGQILLPFPPESPLSGVTGFDHRKTPFLHYRRRFTLEELPAGKRLLLHCGGVDQALRAVSLNGTLVEAEHSTLLSGPLTLELRDLRLGENLLELTVSDFGGTLEPWGKQRKKRGGMWYTPVSGIWQTVWLEWVPARFVTALRCTPTLDSVTVEAFRFPDPAETEPWEALRKGAPGVPAEGSVRFEGRDWPLAEGKVILKPEVPRRWSPEDPHLYRFTLLSGEDRVESYFALRTLEVGVVEGLPRLLLNGKPYFFNGLLDQGYWPDGLWTPADPACFTDDLQLAKDLGFNMVRKHIKVEPELFYYECDRLGVAVFQDMINCGPYSFLRDTALPTLGFQRLPQLFRRRSRGRAQLFSRHMEAVVRQLYSHPAVVYWTIYNEGWGQQRTAWAYRTLKALDSSRIIDTSSGWFRVGPTDVDSRHVYFRPFRLPRSKKPVVLSEFGGYVWKVPAHSFNREKTYGYKSFPEREAFQAAFEALYAQQIWPQASLGLCGAVYTQLSDVEDETNGLITYDRRVVKIEKQEVES